MTKLPGTTVLDEETRFVSSRADRIHTQDDSVLVIQPVSGWIGVNWKELIRNRELLYFLIWRDLKVRYKQTVLGLAWAILQPLLSTFILTLVFGRFARISAEGYPYAVFVYAGLLPWIFFSTGVNMGGLSLVNQQQLLTKIYFPRLFVPTASVFGGLVDLFVSLCVYAFILFFYGIVPQPQVVFLPLLVVLTLLATLGSAYFLAALTVAYRDFRYVIPFGLQIMMYLSPVVYPVSLVPDQYQWVLSLNPMVGIIDGYRSALLAKPWNFTALGTSSVATTALFVAALYCFRRTERYFADVA